MDPMPTAYDGITFRDQTVAQWACFFDALQIPYHYKPESFPIGSEASYSPDFWLPNHNVWIEVVTDELLLHQEQMKFVNLYRITGKTVYVFNGFPSVKTFMSNSENRHVQEICNFGIDVVEEKNPTECLPFQGVTLNEMMQYILGMLAASSRDEIFRANTIRIADAANRSNNYFRDGWRSVSFDFTARETSEDSE